MTTVLLLLILFALVPVTDAQMSGGTIITPGQAPAFVSPTPSGGAIVIRPGQAPGLLTQTLSGGPALLRSGEPPSAFIPSASTSLAPYGITLPGAFDKPLAPYGITLPGAPGH